MSSQEDEADPEALQKRVDELEATVQKMLPGRRAFLAGAAGAAVGAVGMREASNVSEASDGTAVGQIGTSSEPVNVVAHDVTSDSVDTERLGNANVYASAYGSDGAAIQSALDEHGANPCTVHFDVEVTALSSAAPLEIPSNTTVLIEEDITLAGSTPENILQTKDAFTQSNTSGTLQSNINIYGRGGTLDGNKANQTEGSDGFRQCCIHIFADDVLVNNVTVANAQKQNISAVGESSGVQILDSTLKYGSTSNLQFHYKSSGDNTDYGDLLTDCRVERCTSVGGGLFGLKYSGVSDAAIINNTVRDADDLGILVKSGDEPKDNTVNVTVSENLVLNPAGRGIEVRDESTNGAGPVLGVSVSDNTLAGVGSYGIIFEDSNESIEDGSVSDNTLRDIGNNGLNIQASGYVINGNIINNTSDQGINVPKGSDNLVSDNVLRNITNTPINTNSGTTEADNVTQ